MENESKRKAKMEKLVLEYLEGYDREYDYCQQVAKICAKICEEFLDSNGIRAIVSHRAKSRSSLERKISQRIKSENYYCNHDEIRRDIVDLSGVRIALYFPGDQDEVEALVKKCFRLEVTKRFPEDSRRIVDSYEKRFSGYAARHHRVFLSEDALSSHNSRYAGSRVEIQVASVLMHAWSEVEHDLVYKPISGEISREEHEILDQINGLVSVGEMALESLQASGKKRLTDSDKAFRNHYEIASYIVDHYKGGEAALFLERTMGPSDILFRLLRETNLLKPSQLLEFLPKSPLGSESAGTVSDYAIDAISRKSPENRKAYLKTLFGSVYSSRPADSGQKVILDDEYLNRAEQFLTIIDAYASEMAEAHDLPRYLVRIRSSPVSSLLPSLLRGGKLNGLTSEESTTLRDAVQFAHTLGRVRKPVSRVQLEKFISVVMRARQLLKQRKDAQLKLGSVGE